MLKSFGIIWKRILSKRFTGQWQYITEFAVFINVYDYFVILHCTRRYFTYAFKTKTIQYSLTYLFVAFSSLAVILQLHRHRYLLIIFWLPSRFPLSYATTRVFPLYPLPNSCSLMVSIGIQLVVILGDKTHARLLTLVQFPPTLLVV